jgi:hypothetical protein
MRALLLAAAALWLSAASASAQTYILPAGDVQYQYVPNTGFVYSYANGGYATPYSSYYGPTVYGPGYTASYPYMYNQYNYPYRTYYSPGYVTTYRTWRWR